MPEEGGTPRRRRPSEREMAFGLAIDYDAAIDCLRGMDILLRERKIAQAHLSQLPAVFRPGATIGRRPVPADPVRRQPSPTRSVRRWHLSHALLAPQKDESFAHYADRQRDIIRTVWDQAEFLSHDEWRRGPTNDAAALPMPAGGEGWQTELEDHVVDDWIHDLQWTHPEPGGRSRWLACKIVAYRWRLDLNPESLFDKIQAARRKTRFGDGPNA